MGNRLRHTVLLAVLLMLGFSCKDPYNPPVTTADLRYLVVEGDILNGASPTVIKLSRTAKMVDTAFIRPEVTAQVRVEGDNNTSWVLSHTGQGNYSAGILTLNENVKYRLYVRTDDGKEYASSFVAVHKNPPIDSVTWKWEGDEGVKILVNTHDPENKTRYYRWNYTETWEHDTYYFSELKYLEPPPRVVERAPGEVLPMRCWKFENSSSIIIHSTARLANDIVKDKQITRVPNGSWKMGVKYTILVRQYTMAKEALDYWQMMQRNSESLGSIFDPQPSESRGNITCLSRPDEMVIGYVSVGSVQEHRLWISRSELPGWRYGLDCDEYYVPNDPDSLLSYFGSQMYLPVMQDQLTGRILGVTPYCVDCSLMASPIKPDFWQ
ncbi:DUF4249 domain-containing protein [uncultured Chitinophaga sp.]|uniref:DUF4249 domain-containing protein n=1 Tax=uncultured Chitinophaga sp. TaxID=339340 RepID=UPI0025CEA7CC|nr:DUF4249 domain-containing protein [uncultured Chitinophaga sp.]